MLDVHGRQLICKMYKGDNSYVRCTREKTIYM